MPRTGYTQENRRVRVETPQGKDTFLLGGLSGEEGLSMLFHYELEMVVENTKALETGFDKKAFEEMLGQSIKVDIDVGEEHLRYIHGLIHRMWRGGRGTDFTKFRVEIVPRHWTLTRIKQSRIFQQKSVPDILKAVFEGYDMIWEIQGTFEKRDYCVQYRESDFDFASRLMEEEGIFYFFKQEETGHKMVVANTPQSHHDLEGTTTIQYEELVGGQRDEERINKWEKTQMLRSGKYTLWDHCFELPYKHLEASQPVLESVKLGSHQHKLKLGGNDKWEIYDFPGGYAQRFDGISKGGGEQASELQKISQDNTRTVKLRMEQETMPALDIRGESDCMNLIAGHKFSLERHFSDDGAYVLTWVQTDCTQGGDMTSGGGSGELKWENRFTCIPLELPFRPLQKTPKPVIHGTQTATVVGPSGEEIFTDKYGRVKVQFHWDRQGKGDADSSCWVRVGSPWAGKQWGMIHIPRIGNEVIVAFEEGDPDQPIIVGSVYNSDQMPPFKLPDNKTQSGIKSRSTPKAGAQNLNQIMFEDKKGSEYIFIHAEKDSHLRIKHDHNEWIGNNRHETIVKDKFEDIGGESHLKVTGHVTEKFAADHNFEIGGKQAVKVAQSISVKAQSISEEYTKQSVECSSSIYLKAATIVLEASTGLTIKMGGSNLTMTPAGITMIGSPLCTVNSGGGTVPGMKDPLVSPQSPTKPEEPLKPTDTAATSISLSGSSNKGGSKATAKGSKRGKRPPGGGGDVPRHDPNSEENKEKTHWVEAVLVDETGSPVPGEPCEITLPDGTVSCGTTDEQGKYRVEHIDPGQCKITFPNLDKEAWEPK